MYNIEVQGESDMKRFMFSGILVKPDGGVTKISGINVHGISKRMTLKNLIGFFGSAGYTVFRRFRIKETSTPYH